MHDLCVSVAFPLTMFQQLSDDDMERAAADRRVTFDVSESDLSSLEAHDGSGDAHHCICRMTLENIRRYKGL